MDWNSLRMAADVIESGSVQSVANHFGVSASAVSQALRRAEKHFDTALVSRVHRPLAPTKAGATFAREMRDTVGAFSRMEANVRQAVPRGDQKDLRIGLVDTIAASIAPQLLRVLSNDPAIGRLYGRSGLSDDLMDALLRRQVDMLVTCDTGVRRAGLRRYFLATEAFVLLVPRGRAGELADRSLLDILHSHPLIAHGERSHTGEQVDTFLQLLGLNPTRTFAFDTSDALVALVAGGAGVAVTTPLCVLQGRAHLGQVDILTPDGLDLSRDLVLIVHDEGPIEDHEALAATIRALLFEHLTTFERSSGRSMRAFFRDGGRHGASSDKL